MKATLPFILFFGLLCSAAHAQPRQEIVKAELFADVSAVKPGGDFTLGVLLTLEPGWHVYWMNPGDSGRATTVKITAPDGFKVGPLRFPVPLKFNQPGDILGYGYEKSVLLTAEVKAPADLKSGSQTAIYADITWLACKDACIPGKAKPSVSLPTSPQPVKSHEAVFKQWADRFPVDKDPAVKSAAVEADETQGVFTLKIEWNAVPRKVELYPGRDDAVEVQNIAITNNGSQTLATVTARLWPGQKKQLSEKLPMLLIYTDDKGQRHGVNLAVPLAGLREPASKKD